MRLDRKAILNFLRDRDGDRAQQAERDLPEPLDHEEHGDVLSKLGLDPRDMLARFEAKHTGASQRRQNPQSQKASLCEFSELRELREFCVDRQEQG